jgi:hypothetical protein
MPNLQPLLGTLHLHFSKKKISIGGYKSKFDGVRQEYHGYGYRDMMQMKNLYSIFFYGTFQSQNKTKLNAQNNLSLGTYQVGDILVMVHSNSAFKFSTTTLFLIGSFG